MTSTPRPLSLGCLHPADALPHSPVPHALTTPPRSPPRHVIYDVSDTFDDVRPPPPHLLYSRPSLRCHVTRTPASPASPSSPVSTAFSASVDFLTRPLKPTLTRSRQGSNHTPTTSFKTTRDRPPALPRRLPPHSSSNIIYLPNYALTTFNKHPQVPRNDLRDTSTRIEKPRSCRPTLR
ncbi:hypothetical protein R3P38DRAFT_3181178 [Favolaschia claudopus]|uniref:Uncharacterized protein n=1 Tax=Favolaschia claudopus TaxID=2862362 RepID=A0AAW0CN58_9AGAR